MERKAPTVVTAKWGPDELVQTHFDRTVGHLTGLSGLSPCCIAVGLREVSNSIQLIWGYFMEASTPTDDYKTVSYKNPYPNPK